MKLTYIRICGLIFVSMITLMVSACWDEKEIEEMHYIIAMGIDYEDDQCVIYLQSMDFSGIEGDSDGGGKLEPLAKIGIGRGDTLVEAFHNLYTYTQKEMYFAHLTSVILSTTALERDILHSLEALDRFHHIRATMKMYGTDQPMLDILGETPVLEGNILLSLLADPWPSYHESSMVVPISMHQLFRELFEPGQTVRLPNIGVSNRSWHDGQTLQSNIGLNGVHLIQEENYKGLLTDVDIMGLRWLQEETQRAPLIMEKNGKTAVSMILQDPKVNIQVEYEGNQPQFTVHISVEGMVIEIRQNMTEDEIIQATNKAIKQEVEAFFLEGLELNADALRLSYHLYRDNPVKWHQITDKKQLSLNEGLVSSIQVDVDLAHAIENKLRKK